MVLVAQVEFHFNNGLGVLLPLGLLAVAVLHVGFAYVVVQDHGELGRDRRWKRRRFGPGWLWGLAVLLSGVLAVIAYWLIHRSNLGPTPESSRVDPPLTT